MTAFVVLVTPSPSVVRAAVMAAIVLLTLASGRAPRGLPALALATIVMLVADPWLSRSYGLALSVLATSGLLLLARPLHAGLARWMPGRLALVISVPLAAQLACQPVLVLLSPSISTYSVVANLLAEPAAPVATVVGLASCLLGALAPPLAPVGAWLTWVPASWIAGVATFFAHAPGSSIPSPGGVLGVVLVIALTAATLLALFLREDPERRTERLSARERKRTQRLTHPRHGSPRLPRKPRGARVNRSPRPPPSSRARARARSWSGLRASLAAELARLGPVQGIRLAAGGLVVLTLTIWAGAGRRSGAPAPARVARRLAHRGLRHRTG